MDMVTGHTARTPLLSPLIRRAPANQTLHIRQFVERPKIVGDKADKVENPVWFSTIHEAATGSVQPRKGEIAGRAKHNTSRKEMKDQAN